MNSPIDATTHRTGAPSFWARSAVRAAVWRLTVVVALLVLWELATRLHVLDVLYVSSPTKVGAAWVELASNGTVWEALGNTGRAILLAFVISVVAGVVFGILIGLVPLINDAFFPTVLFLLSTPKVVFVPLFILMFGIGTKSVIIFGAFQAFFYVTVEVVGGVHLVQEKHLRVARTYGASWLQTIWHVVVPAASPGLFSAIWFGLKQSLVGALIVELFVSAGGLGDLIHKYTRSLRTDYVLGLVLAVAIVAILVGVAVNSLEQRLCRWQTQESGSKTL